jgi:hypothetical protein
MAAVAAVAAVAAAEHAMAAWSMVSRRLMSRWVHVRSGPLNRFKSVSTWLYLHNHRVVKMHLKKLTKDKQSNNKKCPMNEHTAKQQ